MPASIADRVKPLLSAFHHADLEILVELVVLVAYSDGTVDDEELDALREAFEAMVGSPLSVLAVKTLVGGAIDDIKAAGVSAFASRLGKELGERGKGEDGLRLGYAIAMANHELASYESERLILIAEGAGITETTRVRIESEVER